MYYKKQPHNKLQYLDIKKIARSLDLDPVTIPKNRYKPLLRGLSDKEIKLEISY